MRACLAVAALSLFVAPVAAQEGIAIKTVATLKDATVLIRLTDGAGWESSGSGFLIGGAGRTGYLVTNHHVVRPERDNDGGALRIEVVFRSGTKSERMFPAEIVETSKERDLAVLRVVDVPDLPTPVDMGRAPEPVETTPVYIFGFPFGEQLAADRGRISVVVGKGSVSSLRRNEAGDVKAVLIDGALNPGNSGGPVVDPQGRLVGVAVATIRGAHIGIAIAPAELTGMLDGRIGGLDLALQSARDGKIELVAEVALIDPLGKLKSLSLLHAANVIVEKHDETPRQPIPRAETTALSVVGGRARGTIRLSVAAGDGLDLSCQVAYRVRDGRTAYSRVTRYFGTADADGLRLWGELNDPEGDDAARIDGSALRFTLPAHHKDLNSDVGKWNAPRVLQEVTGDFTAQVKIRGEFQPEAPSTRQGAYPCTGAGLVVWLDDHNFIRLERFAILRNGRTGAFLLFERREDGRKNSNNNGALAEGDVFLKIERRGDVVSGFSSTDGAHWDELRPLDVSWPDRLKVGVVAVSASSAPFPVRFEGFSVQKHEP